MKLKWIQKIVVIFLLLGSLNIAHAYWRQEADGTFPSGTFGLYFQYGDAIAAHSTCNFNTEEAFSWSRQHNSIWCFMGSVATIALQYRWPKKSYFKGNWNSSFPDYYGEVQNADLVTINHPWDYQGIIQGVNSSNFLTDNPLTRSLIMYAPQMASEEIRRLFGAVRLAYENGGNYGDVFTNNDRIKIVLEKLGFSCRYQVVPRTPVGDLSYLNPLASCLINESGKSTPCIVKCNSSGHVWIIDGYDPNSKKYHSLQYQSAKTRWTTDPIADYCGGQQSYVLYHDIQPATNLQLTNTTLNSGDVLYKESPDNISVSTNFIVNSGSTLELAAAKMILFASGTVINSGASMSATVTSTLAPRIFKTVIMPKEDCNDSSKNPNITLLQNSPNPANPETQISYIIRGSFKTPKVRVDLCIYDAQGKLIRPLVSKHMNPGIHTVKWDGKDFNGNTVVSGRYFYKLKLESGATITRCLFLIK